MKTTEFSIDKAAKLLRIERTDFDEVARLKEKLSLNFRNAELWAQLGAQYSRTAIPFFFRGAPCLPDLSGVYSNDAISSFETALALNDSATSVWVELGKIAYRAKKWETAAEAFSEVFAKDPGPYQWFSLMTHALLATGKAEATLECYEKTRAVVPGQYIPIDDEIRALLHLGRVSEVEERFQNYDFNQECAEPLLI
ncbi:MAG: hypothetical protein HQM09_00945 [Candidatus Riflebacteria bacterium]|nr:hypothetical protein [Candidatus Riflebacteria bacterium]